jgi:hypothetical protein
MKKLLFAITIFLGIEYANAGLVIVVNSTKIGGDGSGNYNYTYRNVTQHNETASPWIQIDVFCEGAGNNACPKAFSPIAGSDPALEGTLDPSVITGCDALFDIITEKANAGNNTGKETIQVSLTGSDTINRIIADWVLESDGNIKITYYINEVN